MAISRQRQWQIDQKAKGLCENCTNQTWRGGRCFRCTIASAFQTRGILKDAKKASRSWERFVAGMMARYTRILEDEGFAFESEASAVELIALADMKWAKFKKKKHVLEVISKFDERALMERFRGGK